MYCRNCGAEVNAKAIACPKCGVPPLSEKKFCQECGNETNEKQMICVKCGVKLISKGGSGGGSVGDFKIDTSSLSNTLNSPQLSFLDAAYMKTVALVSSIAMVIILFLPWYRGEFGNKMAEGSDTLNALQTLSVKGYEEVKTVSIIGVIILLCSLGAVVANFKKFKWTFLLGVVAFLFALIWTQSLPSGKIQAGDSEISAGVVWGAYLFFACALANIVSNIKTFKES